jgi:hypothetical protein
MWSPGTPISRFTRIRYCGFPIRIQVRHGLDEDHDVAALWLAIVNQRHPLGGRSEGDAVHHQVIAHQQRLLHRAGGNDEVLARKVRMNRPTTSTEQMLATASKGVSSTRSSTGSGWVSGGVLGGGVFFFVILSLVSVSVVSFSAESVRR